MNTREEKAFRKMSLKHLEKLAQENDISWCELSLYLEREYDDGVTEFRLVVNKDKSFYIHPFGKDGKTFDGKL